MSIENDLLSLKSKGEQLNTQKIQNATKLAALEEEKNKLLAEAQELGIDPQKIEEVLKQETEALQTDMNKVKEEQQRILDAIRAI